MEKNTTVRPFKVEFDKQYRLRQSNRLVVCVHVDEEQSFGPNVTVRRATFEFYKKNEAHEEIAFELPEPLWGKYLKPKEITAEA